MLFFCIERRWVQHSNELPDSVPEQRYETVNRTFIATTADIKTSILRLYAKSVFRQARDISRSDHDITASPGWVGSPALTVGSFTLMNGRKSCSQSAVRKFVASFLFTAIRDYGLWSFTICIWLWPIPILNHKIDKIILIFSFIYIRIYSYLL